MQRWAIKLDATVRRRLTSEQLELGTIVTGDDGRPLLVFRDRFVGLRVASSAGTTLSSYQLPLEAAAV